MDGGRGTVEGEGMVDVAAVVEEDGEIGGASGERRGPRRGVDGRVEDGITDRVKGWHYVNSHYTLM